MKQETKESSFLYEISLKEIPMTNMFETTIRIEGGMFTNNDFYQEFSDLINKHMSRVSKQTQQT